MSIAYFISTLCLAVSYLLAHSVHVHVVRKLYTHIIIVVMNGEKVKFNMTEPFIQQILALAMTKDPNWQNNSTMKVD